MAEDVRLEDEEDKLLDELAALNEADPQFNTKRQQYENAQRRKAEAAVSRYGRETVEKLKDELGERMRFTFWLMDSLLEPDGRVPEHVVRETALRYPDFDEHIQRLLGEGKEDVLHEYVTAFAIWSVTSARGEHEAEVGRAAFYYLFRDQGHQLFEEWCTHAERVHYGQEGRLIPPFEDWLAEFEAWKKRRKVALPPSPNPFLNAVVPFASCKPAMGTVEAIFNAKAGWPLDENGLPRYVVRMEGKRAKGDFSYHILLPTDSPDEEAINTLAQKELALQILRDLGPDTAWLHMLLLAYAVETRRGERFVTPREVIYRILGLDKRSDLDRGEKDARCFDEIDHLRRLGINIMRLELNGKELTYGRRMGPIWELAWEEYGQGYLVLLPAC
jgi:AcrR family transcriptional regulator